MEALCVVLVRLVWKPQFLQAAYSDVTSQSTLLLQPAECVISLRKHQQATSTILECMPCVELLHASLLRAHVMHTCIGQPGKNHGCKFV